MTTPDILTELAKMIARIRREIIECERAACDLGGEGASTRLIALRAELDLLRDGYISESERRRGHSCPMHDHDTFFVGCASCKAAWARREGKVAA